MNEINLNKKTQPETEIRPQWLSVKEEILYDFFNLSNSFANFRANPSNTAIRKQWTTNLKSLYIKIRLKIYQNEKYSSLVENMDKYVFDFKAESIINQAKYTRQLCQFIEEIGLTKVEQEKLDPFENYERNSFS